MLVSGAASVSGSTDGDDYTEWAPNPGVAYTKKVELWVAGFPNGDYSLNGGSWTAIGDSESEGFQAIATGSGTITNLKFRRVARDGYDAGNTAFPSIVKVDGHALLDSAVDNSYHLKFDDTSSNAALGYDALSTDLSTNKAINGASILATDKTGTPSSGYRTDENDDDLLIAMPCNANDDDVHATIIGSGSNAISCEFDSGIVFERRDAGPTHSVFFWDESANRFAMGNGTIGSAIITDDHQAGAEIMAAPAYVVTVSSSAGNPVDAIPEAFETPTGSAAGTGSMFGNNNATAVGQMIIQTAEDMSTQGSEGANVAGGEAGDIWIYS